MKDLKLVSFFSVRFYILASVWVNRLSISFTWGFSHFFIPFIHTLWNFYYLGIISIAWRKMPFCPSYTSFRFQILRWLLFSFIAINWKEAKDLVCWAIIAHLFDYKSQNTSGVWPKCLHLAYKIIRLDVKVFRNVYQEVTPPLRKSSNLLGRLRNFHMLLSCIEANHWKAILLGESKQLFSRYPIDSMRERYLTQIVTNGANFPLTIMVNARYYPNLIDAHRINENLILTFRENMKESKKKHIGKRLETFTVGRV